MVAIDLRERSKDKQKIIKVLHNAKRQIQKGQKKIPILAIAVALLFSYVLASKTITPLTLSVSFFIILFSLMWPYFYLTSWNYKPKLQSDHAAPFFSIIVPAKNEENIIARIINCIKDQSYKNWELVVVVNHSTDKTFDYAMRAADSDPRVKVIDADLKEVGKAVALNEGLRASSGDVLIQFDADSVVQPNFLSVFAKYFRDSRIHAIQSAIRAGNQKYNLLTRLQDMEFIIYSRVFNKGRQGAGLSSSIGGTGVGIRREVLEEIGGWRNELVEDYELLTRLIDNNFNIIYVDETVTYDEKPMYWDMLIRQRKRWIKGHMNVMAEKVFQKKRSIWDTLYMLTPIYLFLSTGLLIVGYLHMLLENYITYSYILPDVWLATLIILSLIMADVMVREKEYSYILLVPVYLLFFAFHWIVVLFSSFKVASWSPTKTYHFGDVRDSTSNKFILGYHYFGIRNLKSLSLLSCVVLTAALWLYPLYSFYSTPRSSNNSIIMTSPRLGTVNAQIIGGQGLSSRSYYNQSLAVIEGSVKSEGNPVAGAQVTLTKVSSGRRSADRTSTNQDGYFRFEKKEAPATYQLTVQKRGYVPVSGRFTLGNGQSAKINVELRRKGPGSINPVIIPY